jgi:hypothetical protein
MSQELLERLLLKVEGVELRLASAKSLNGGFDKLLVEVEHIKETQDEILQGMRGIKKSIYEPDSGLFSRVKQLEVESDRRMEYVKETKPALEFAKELVGWKQHADKELEEMEKLRLEVAELRSWRINISKLIWLIATAAGGVWVKLFMDFMMK